MKRIDITITEQLIVAVKAHMQKTGLTFSDIIRQALTAYLDEYTAREQAQSRGKHGRRTASALRSVD